MPYKPFKGNGSWLVNSDEYFNQQTRDKCDRLQKDYYELYEKDRNLEKQNEYLLRKITDLYNEIDMLRNGINKLVDNISGRILPKINLIKEPKKKSYGKRRK